MELTITGLGLGYIGIMEKNLETAIVYWGYVGIILKSPGFSIKVSPSKSPSYRTPMLRIGFRI